MYDIYKKTLKKELHSTCKRPPQFIRFCKDIIR